jgi:hypothetical protein
MGWIVGCSQFGSVHFGGSLVGSSPGNMFIAGVLCLLCDVVQDGFSPQQLVERLVDY